MEKANVGAYINIGEFSAEEQEQKLKTWASENDARIHDFYIDKTSKSEPLNNRQEFKRLLGDIKSHKIDSILTIDYDRLTDDKSKLDNLLNGLESDGVKIYSISDTLRG